MDDRVKGYGLANLLKSERVAHALSGYWFQYPATDEAGDYSRDCPAFRVECDDFVALAKKEGKDIQFYANGNGQIACRLVPSETPYATERKKIEEREAKIAKRNEIYRIGSVLAGHPAPDDKEVGRLADTLSTLVDSPRYRGNRMLAFSLHSLIDAVADLSMSVDTDGRVGDAEFDALEEAAQSAKNLLYKLERK